MKPIVLRTCVITRRKYPVDQLIRLTKKDGKLVIDKKSEMQGRGVYIINDFEIVNDAIQTKQINRSLRGLGNNELFNELIKYLNS